MPGEPLTQGTYITIVGGNLRQKVEKGTPGAQYREYKIKGKKGEEITGSKYELVFQSWKGKIKGIRFKDNQFGTMCNIDLGDAIISINTDSKYFASFAEKIFSADLKQDIIIRPYDFVGDEGKELTGISLTQKDKLKSYFYDGEKSTNGMPEPEGDTKKFKSDDWKIYFTKKKLFLIKKMEEMEFEAAPASTGVDLEKAGTDDAKEEVKEEVGETIETNLPWEDPK